jgi:diguanylate cyclase (GGDEF)-like protein
MPETSAETALTQANQVHRALTETVFSMKNGLKLGISASVGVATAPTDGKTVHAVIGSADTRMYAVKSNGRGRVHGA